LISGPLGGFDQEVEEGEGWVDGSGVGHLCVGCLVVVLFVVSWERRMWGKAGGGGRSGLLVASSIIWDDGRIRISDAGCVW
jgi:hypothetical protein